MRASAAQSNTNNHYELFHAALKIRSYIHKKNAEAHIPWPPSASDLDLEKCKNMIPTSLYNFIAILVGAVEEPTDMSAKYIIADHQLCKRVTSISQDLMYLESKGANPTPKSLALGLTLRHMTGSKSVSRLLSGFGHACSYDTTVRLETMLALKQVHDSDTLPPGFSKKTFTVLVYDNIDFSEETLTGHGTTHHTNGLMIQLKSQDCPAAPDTEDGSRLVGLPKSTRTFNMPAEEILPYYQAARKGPQNIAPETAGQNYDAGDFASSKAADLSFIMRKVVNASEDMALPGWTAHNIKISDPLPLSKIHYLPVIEASPTDLATVKHILEDVVKYCNKVECESVMLVMDQAIYSKAQQIRWAVEPDSPYYRQVVPRLGEFHTIMCFLSIIGKRFSLSGLDDILIESELVAAGSMNGVLSGKMYNRSVRAHKVLFEALSRLQMISFVESLDDEHRASVSQFAQSEDHSLVMDEDLITRYNNYIEERSSNRPTFAFWKSYQDMVLILLAFIRATRTSDWNLHLAALRQMLPWMFA